MTSPQNPQVTEQLRQIAEAEPGLLDALGKAESTDAALQLMAAASARTGLPLDLAAARDAMAHAQTDSAALSDEALDAVAGGVVDVGMVLLSIKTLGLGCAVASILVAVGKQDCGSAFHH